MRQEIENKLIDLCIGVNELVLSLKNTQLNQIVGGQVLRSSTGAALNYGEAQSAESKKDFIHKLSIVLKELRETEISLKIISRTGGTTKLLLNKNLIIRCKSLIGIIQKSINTLKSRQ